MLLFSVRKAIDCQISMRSIRADNIPFIDQFEYKGHY